MSIKKISNQNDPVVSVGLISQALLDADPGDDGKNSACKHEYRTIQISARKLPSVLSDPNIAAWTPAAISDYPEGESWISQQILVMNFGHEFKLDDVKARLDEYGLDCSLIYATTQQGRNLRNYAVVWVLEEPVTVRTDRDALIDAIHYLLPGAEDFDMSPTATFQPVSEVIYHNPEYSISPVLLLVAGQLAYISNGDPSERTINRRINEMAKNCKSLIIIRGLQKFAKTDKPRNYRIDSSSKIQLVRSFIGGEILSVAQLFGLASNLLYVSGGLKQMEEKMNDVDGYSVAHRSVIPYIRKMKLESQELKDFSSFEEDWVYKNVIQAGKLNKQDIVRIKPYSPRSLEEGEDEFFKIMWDIRNNYDHKIHLIKAPPGLGKTEFYLDWEGIVIALPNHTVKDEISGRMKVSYDVTKQLPELINLENRKKLEWYYKIGANKKANTLIKEIIEAHPKYTYSIDPDVINLDDYLYFMRLSKYTDDTVITTHQNAINLNNKSKTYIFDEDPLTSGLLKVETVYLNDVRELYLSLSNINDKRVIKKILDAMLDAAPNTLINVPPHVYEDYNQIEDIVANNGSYKGNILHFLDAKCFIMTSREGNEFKFIKTQLLPENKQVIILSATVEEWIYRRLYGDRVVFHDISDIEHKGTVLQDSTFTFSKYSMDQGKALEYAKKSVGDTKVISFMGYKNEFPNACNDLYFFKSTGSDSLRGEEISVVGTPHFDNGTYLLYANALGLNYKNTDFNLNYRRIDYNGFDFWFQTFDNLELRRLQFYLIESELVQAIGRARTLRDENAKVTLYSNYPIRFAKQMNEWKTK